MFFAKIGHVYHRQLQYQGEEHVQSYQTGQVTKAEQRKQLQSHLGFKRKQTESVLLTLFKCVTSPLR